MIYELWWHWSTEFIVLTTPAVMTGCRRHQYDEHCNNAGRLQPSLRIGLVNTVTVQLTSIRRLWSLYRCLFRNIHFFGCLLLQTQIHNLQNREYRGGATEKNYLKYNFGSVVGSQVPQPTSKSKWTWLCSCLQPKLLAAMGVSSAEAMKAFR